ncbi:MAG TPA: PHB depolymerase family esterase [Labilithrix sp.]|jgi:poly(3-hydroxybutyrate) depolymerase|nr:PHB depolymerase family esterase [Labilithrix sp.]
MRFRFFLPAFVCLTVAALACTEKIVKVEGAAPSDPADAGDTTDTGATGPTGPESIPVVRLEADPATDCPASYRDVAPKEGNNTGYSVAGQEREFTLFLPDDLSEPRPLLVGFNGTGEDGPSFSARAKLADFAAKGFIVVAPSSNGNGSTWPVWDSLRKPGTENDPNKDLELFDSLVKCVAGHHQVDKNRIYVAGHSAGGIMTNHVLQRRSKLLAGGIPASGVFSLTSPKPPEPLDPLFVIVTWGGDNDKYTGTAGGVSVGGFNFATEASLASTYYDAEANVGEVNCRGNNVGHAWLSGLNDWFAAQLLAHPKGWSGKGQPDLAPPVPADAKAVCKDEPYAGTKTIEVACQTSTTDGCQQTCQLFGDCAVENGTVGPALKTELTAIGFSGPNNASCGGCVANCEVKATTASDAAALACFKQHQAKAECAQGIEGAYPLVDAVNKCCEGRKDSPWCVSICTEIKKNSSAQSFFATCSDIAP